jgi:hypothetical protein
VKGPFENNKIYAIAATSKGGVSGGVLPAVFAYDTRYDEGRFFTIGRDEAEASGDDVFNANLVGELMLDSAEDAGYRVPERQVLSLWSRREEALREFTARSERGKAASQTKKALKAQREQERWNELQAAPSSAEARIEAHSRVLSIGRIIRGEKDVVLFSLRLKPEEFRDKIAPVLGIDAALVDEWLIESKKDD